MYSKSLAVVKKVHAKREKRFGTLCSFTQVRSKRHKFSTGYSTSISYHTVMARMYRIISYFGINVLNVVLHLVR